MNTHINRYMAAFGILLTVMSQAWAQTDRHDVFSEVEAVNFGTVDFSAPGGQTWSTFRGAAPGYFGAVGAATYTGTSDANANVDGDVKYYANNSEAAAFNFPVGTGTDLRNLSISGVIPPTGVFATAWIVGDPTTNSDPTVPNAGVHPTSELQSGIAAVSKAGMWDWQDLSTNASGMTITVSIPDVSTFSRTEDLRLVGWSGTQWVALGTSGGSGNTENSTLSGTMQPGITAIGIGTTSTALPVTLVSFTAVSEGAATLLEWSTATETNSAFFEIERASDGKNWQQIGKKQALKESTVWVNYSFIDGSPMAGLNYYRLRMVDLDGTFAYSSIRVVRNKEADSVLVYPNPVSSVFYVKGVDMSQVREIVLTDLSGKIWMRTSGDFHGGVSLDKLERGLYLLKITTGDGVTSTHKLIVKGR